MQYKLFAALITPDSHTRPRWHHFWCCWWRGMPVADDHNSQKGRERARANKNCAHSKCVLPPVCPKAALIEYVCVDSTNEREATLFSSLHTPASFDVCLIASTVDIVTKRGDSNKRTRIDAKPNSTLLRWKEFG